MDKLSYLLGLPVLEIETGKQIGAVQEVLLDVEQAIVKGIILNDSQIDHCDAIAFSNIYSVGNDAVTIRSAAESETNILHFTDSIYHFNDLRNKQIYTETGLLLGILVDIYFDNGTGELKGFQVSDGLVSDLLYGRQTMPLPQAQVIGQDKMIVPDSMAKLLHILRDSDNV